MGKRIDTAPLPRVAALYSRVSSKPQDAEDKTSLDTQEAGEKRWAHEHGWLTDDRFTYRERHTGEELWERPELTRLREAARARSFGVLVCHSIERLSRNPIHLGILLDELSRIGVDVQFVTEELDDSPEAALIRYIKSYAGQVENERRRERQIRATRARADAGYPIATGPAPYGYCWADNPKTRYVVNPITAPIVARIFRDYAHGATLREMAGALTAEGVPTPKGRNPVWKSGTVRTILRNSIYWGAPRTGKTRTERVPLDQRANYTRKSVARELPISEQVALPSDVAPPLVEADVATLCAQRLRTNQQLASRSAKDPESALLRGFVRCGLCGGAVGVNRRSARSHTRKDGSLPSRYVCHNARRVVRDATHGWLCTPHAIYCERLDAAVWGKVEALLRDPSLITQEVERMRTCEPPGAADLAALDARIASLARRIESLSETAGYASDGEARRSLAEQIDLAARQKRQTEAERAQVAQLAADWDAERTQLEALAAQITRVAEHLDTWGYADKRDALIALKCEVTLYEPAHAPARVDLGLRLPLSGRLRLGKSTSDTYIVM
jgi:site-specific DNA recombinase